MAPWALGRILRAADFQRVLATPPRVRTAHFALHHLAAWPSLPAKPRTKAVPAELSTAALPVRPLPVDDTPVPPSYSGSTTAALAIPERPSACWLGLVVPKRHARRAVTRNLIKRQARHLVGNLVGNLSGDAVDAEAVRATPPAAAETPGTGLEPGLWVLRLKAPFDPACYASASSHALRGVVRTEMQDLLRRARQPRRAVPARVAPAHSAPVAAASRSA